MVLTATRPPWGKRSRRSSRFADMGSSNQQRRAPHTSSTCKIQETQTKNNNPRLAIEMRWPLQHPRQRNIARDHDSSRREDRFEIRNLRLCRTRRCSLRRLRDVQWRRRSLIGTARAAVATSTGGHRRVQARDTVE
ncbi:hypothetical protein TIFTF001_010398 [Ficus carica]|uniref:Uncharacterized protein n=1 Tax=Ficus carica TaxID=3494 RepID=A0AA88D4H5_FICCA|nr:hypothetical protein TIFTF001_010398 [Ficus carica]